MASNKTVKYSTVNIEPGYGESETKSTKISSLKNTNMPQYGKKYKTYFISWIIALIFLSPAVASLVIALKYDKNASSCNGISMFGNSDQSDGLKRFLMIAGITQLIQFGLNTFVLLIIVCFGVNLNENAGNKGSGCMGLFYLSWAIIGLVMYAQQMSPECQQEAIGKMVLAWSVIQLSFIPLVCFCICCVVACVVAK
eukprot:40628_1